MVIVFCLIGKARRFANCKICASFIVLLYVVCFKMSLYLNKRLQIVAEQWYHATWGRPCQIMRLVSGQWSRVCGEKTRFHERKAIKTKKEGLTHCHTCLMSSGCLENTSTVLTRVTSYLLCSFPLWFVLYVQDKQSRCQWNLMQLWMGPLGKQHPNKLAEPWGGRSLAQDEWGGRQGRRCGGDQWGGGGGARQGGQETRREQSDEVLKLKESCYLAVQSCDEMWRWYLGCAKKMSSSCFIGLNG